MNVYEVKRINMHRITRTIYVIILLSIVATGLCATTTTVTSSITDSDTPTTPSEVSGEEDATAIEFLEKLEAKYQDVTTVKGEFQQVKRSTIFLEEIKSQGVFYFKKPGKFRCDYLPPNESVNIVVDNTAWLYVPEIKQVEKYYFDRSGNKVQRLNQMLLGFGISVEDVLEVYEIELVEKHTGEQRIVIKFILKEDAPKVNFESVTITFNTQTLEVTKIYIDEVGNDETYIDIKKIELNEWISDAQFRPFFPQDVEIIEHY